jgi:LysM repeat protein
MVAAFARESIALGVNDLIDLIIVAVAPVGMFLIASILLRRAVRTIRRWWPTHPRVAAAFAALLAGVLLFQGQGLVGRLTASPPSSGPTVVATHGARQTPQHHVPRWPKVFTAPSGSVVPPSTALAQVSSHPAPARVYVVQPGDTLWTIAVRQLGDPEQWLAIFDLNAGRPQPGGRSLVDPDLIDPGWSLELPSSQPGATVIANPSSPSSTTDADAAGPFLPPHEPSGFSPSVAVVPAPMSPARATSAGVSQPITSASRPAPPTATQPLTTADQSKAPGPCGRRSLTCQSPSVGTRPGASARPPASRGAPPPTHPPPFPPGSLKRPENPGDDGVGKAVVGGQAATGVPDERSPPHARHGVTTSR